MMRSRMAKDAFGPHSVPVEGLMPFSDLAWYLKSAIWAVKRGKKLVLVGYKCERCGKPTSTVTHKRFDTLGCESMSDLEVVCNRCRKG